MSVDTPAKIAIIGGGPIGLEAALYARYLGYDVDLYERGRVLQSVREAGHITWFAPWERNVTSLGVASIRNQDAEWRPARAGELLTGAEWVERYFEPLSKCDLLADCLQEETEVVAVGREGLLKSDLYQDERRIDVPFRLLVVDAEGNERVEYAEVVFDCSGVNTIPNPLGNGGVPARGESGAAEQIVYSVPDLAGADSEFYSGVNTLVVGGGYAAATTVVGLAKLAEADPETRCAWVTRRSDSGGQAGPIPQLADDPLPERDALAQRANMLAVDPSSCVEHLPATFVEAVEWNEETQNFSVELSGRHAGFRTFEHVVANVGFTPDLDLCGPLQILYSPTTEGPAPLAQLIERQTQTGSVATTAELAQSLLNPEPDFYVLGSKSYGRRTDFTIADGHAQIRALFTIIGDRETLDLYKTHPA
jgi:hypothetical protein